ncbi:aminotransferase [Bacillus manliponensis]|uniref:Aminotransferase n=1 Tax=Bacillus manliponensis TaxID=574376 RepID=A0A073KE74_9BACI|nr:aspartate aminotransferase family protein [Bacillus manliponensis]KEK20608.1 aminotransferase [Bacillus manliponensis]
MVKTKQSEELLMKDEQYVWHGMRPHSPKQVMIGSKAEGCWVEDSEGKRYLDGMSGLWCVNSGYGRKELAEAAYEQLQKLSYFPMSQSHEPAIQLAEKINEWLGGEYVIFFSNSGSEANETAFKIARQYYAYKGEPHRFKFISRYRAYHGNTMAAMAATGQAQRKYQYEPFAAGFLHVTAPDCYRTPGIDKQPIEEVECVKEVDRVMNWELSETIAGFIMEPLITGGGILMPPEDYMKAIHELCKKHGAILISDEVICGFGRTGKPFGFQNYGVQPDIITMAKGLTSGYLPLSATAVKKEIYEAFQGKGEYEFFRHINTFGGNPAACALALKNLEIMENERLSERSAQMGALLLGEIKKEMSNHPFVGDIRGKGLLVGIELVNNKETKEPIDNDKIASVVNACKEKGLIIGRNGMTTAGYNNVLTLAPPLVISSEEIAFIVGTLKAAMERIR